jgi:Tfp pilus assembly protein PilX
MRRVDPHGEQGSVLVIAIVLTAIMVTLGLASLAFVDGQQKRAREQRQRETSLNLAEAVLYSQGFALAQAWPGNAASGATVPTTCTSASAQALCPDAQTLAAGNSSTPAAANFTNLDASASVSWTTRIRDNGAPVADAFSLAQSEAAQSGTNVASGAAYTCPGPCKWDANGDLKLWVEARAVVQGRPRDIVALLKREQFSEPFPRNTITAGSFETTNKGNKLIVDARGSQVVVRCLGAAPACTDYAANKGQILPAIVHDASAPPAMTDSQLERFKAVAQSANPSTYYTSCPASYTGKVVYVDVSDTTVCGDSSVTYNSAASPGIVIMPRGRMGPLNGTYYGIIYLANKQGTSGLTPVLWFGDNAEIFGGVAVDGAGRLTTGQSSGPRPSLTFSPDAFNGLATFGTTGLVQNTWRELPAG